MTAFHTIAIPYDDILQGRLNVVAGWQREKLLDGFLAGRDRI